MGCGGFGGSGKKEDCAREWPTREWGQNYGLMKGD